MSQRKKYGQRCGRCLMRFEICICSAIPQLDLATRLVLVIRRRELQCPSNTGRLAALALPESRIVLHGEVGQKLDLATAIDPALPTYLLYPSEDAMLLGDALKGPINLIVPDGNWRQTAKMRRRDPSMAALPTLRLPPSAPSLYRIRKESQAEGLATLEAIARALGVIEGEAVQKALERLLDLMTRRILWSRGAGLPDDSARRYPEQTAPRDCLASGRYQLERPEAALPAAAEGPHS